MRGEHGCGPEPDDDLTIHNPAELWRRIFPDWWVLDKNLGEFRLSTQAFENSKDGTPMSVTIAAECPGQNHMLSRFKGYGLASFTAAHVRKCGQTLQRDPAPEDPAHAYVVGKKTGSVKKCLLRGTTIVVIPQTED